MKFKKRLDKARPQKTKSSWHYVSKKIYEERVAHGRINL